MRELHGVKAKRMPNELGADEVEAHKVTWCRASVTGRGWSSNHIVGSDDYDALAVAGFNCGLARTGDGMPTSVC